MKVDIKEDTKIILALSQFEATWLKGLVQNPFNGISPMEENSTDSLMRSKFWSKLKEVK